MDLNQENLPVVCVTERGSVRGRIRPRPRPVALAEADTPVIPELVLPPDPSFLALYDVTILDHERRVMKRLPELLVNLRHVVWVQEDDLAPQMDRIKQLLANEDTDAALADLERLLAVSAVDGEILYLAGVVYQHAGQDERAYDHYSRALQMTTDEKVRGVIKRHIETSDKS